MKNINIKRAFLATVVFAFGTLGAVTWSPGNGLSLSIESAQARVGRPGTPVSVAGVAQAPGTKFRWHAGATMVAGRAEEKESECTLTRSRQ